MEGPLDGARRGGVTSFVLNNTEDDGEEEDNEAEGDVGIKLPFSGFSFCSIILAAKIRSSTFLGCFSLLFLLQAANLKISSFPQ